MPARFLALAWLFTFLPAARHAATIEVAPGPDTSLQDALDAPSPGDTLQLGDASP